MFILLYALVCGGLVCACACAQWKGAAQVLTALQGLRSLAVNRCPRIGDKGLLIVQRLSHLTALNCYGCVKVLTVVVFALSALCLPIFTPLTYFCTYRNACLSRVLWKTQKQSGCALLL